LGVRVNFAETEQAIGDPADLASGGGGNHADEADVVTQRAGNRAVADSFHLGKGVNKALILALFKGLDKNLSIFGGGKFIDFNADADNFAELRAGAHGAGFDGFILHAAREKGKRADREKGNEHQTADGELRRIGKSDSFWKHDPPPFDFKEGTKYERGAGRKTERADLDEKSWDARGAFDKVKVISGFN